MEVLGREELRMRYKEILERIKNNEIFIHPTDTIYGLGCLASNEPAVKKIRDIKEQQDKPFFIWAPTLDWIKENFDVSQELLEKLPGPYTLMLKLKDSSTIAPNVAFGSTVGVRLPDHWFHRVVEDLNEPIITTSANRLGNPFMTNVDNLDPDIEKEVDFMIYEGEKKARPSKIVKS